VKAYVSELKAFNASGTILARLQSLYEVAAVMDSGRDWRWIRRIASQIRARHVPSEKRSRLVDTADLLALGQKLMNSAPAERTKRFCAITFRDGLIIALLAARPLRLRNLAGLELERTLARRGETWCIAIPPEETKTGQIIELSWPEVLIAPLSRYLNEHRPVLCKVQGRWARPIGQKLWVSGRGSPMMEAALYSAIVKRTLMNLGRRINPHLFRDCAATSIAIADPAHVRIASQLLGHRSAATTEKYYNQAQAIDAARRYQDFLVALRNGTIAEDTEPV
jgi:integrase